MADRRLADDALAAMRAECVATLARQGPDGADRSTCRVVIDLIDEVCRLRGLVVEHHAWNAMRTAKPGDRCPVCAKHDPDGAALGMEEVPS